MFSKIFLYRRLQINLVIMSGILKKFCLFSSNANVFNLVGKTTSRDFRDISDGTKTHPPRASGVAMSALVRAEKV